MVLCILILCLSILEHVVILKAPSQLIRLIKMIITNYLNVYVKFFPHILLVGKYRNRNQVE